LEKANDVLQQFAYASAHDLKEPLRSISGFVSIIDRKYAQLLPEESSSYMTFVVSGVKRMESLIAALLEYSTLASDEEDIKQASPIEQILADVKANLNGIIVEKKAVIEYLGYLPALKISRLHLTQLFQNLIGNAVKFSNEKPLVQIKGLIEKGQYIIEIKDNGIGMEAEYSDKIFHLFQRLSRSVEGTGIGLAICKEIVNKYDGTIRFDSVKNVGTTFILSFPEQLISDK
jgi:light-regulated signal transduction histidine kinase (bacteriophytochrome)